MISIIISSANKKLLYSLKGNIAATIGVPFEIISFANEGGQSGICELYNKGIGLAQYSILCFMHEDVIFHTIDWGKAVIETFKNDNQLGVIGVAGSYYKALTPSGWSPQGMNTECSDLIQHYKYSIKESHRNYLNPSNNPITEVACIDGLWLCVPKSIAKKYGFDEKTFKGFHCYDQDFSLSVGQEYKIAVVYNVLLAHLSEGGFGTAWLSDVLKLHDKWHNLLPVNKGNISRKDELRIEKVTFKNFLKQLTLFKMPFTTAFKVLWQDSFYQKMGLKLFLKLNYYTFKKTLYS